MRKGTQAMPVGMIAAIAFNLAASTRVEASMPPKYQGEWCLAAPIPNQIKEQYNLCRYHGPQGDLTKLPSRLVLDEHQLTMFYGHGKRLVCKAESQYPQHVWGEEWTVHYDCEGKVLSMRFWRGERGGEPRLYFQDLVRSDEQDAFVRARQHRRQMEDIYREPKP